MRPVPDAPVLDAPVLDAPVLDGPGASIRMLWLSPASRASRSF